MNRFTDTGILWDDDYEVLVRDAKPCPFCGNRYIKTNTPGFYDEVGYSILIIGCLECGCQVAYFSNDQVEDKKTYDEAFAGALAKWNRRTAG